MMRGAVMLAILIMLSGCGGISWPVGLTVAGAVLGFGAKALDLDRAVMERACPAPRQSQPDDAEPDDSPRVIEI